MAGRRVRLDSPIAELKGISRQLSAAKIDGRVSRSLLSDAAAVTLRASAATSDFADRLRVELVVENCAS